MIVCLDTNQRRGTSLFISVLHFSVTIIMVFNNEYNSYTKISPYSAVER
jgi:hypothetical protein